MDLLILLLGFFVGYAVGTLRAYLKFAREIKDAADAIGIDLDQELEIQQPKEKLVYKLAVEKHGETLYLFDKEEDSFICQGSNVQELAKLAKQYKNIMHAAVLYDNKVFQFKDGESTEVL